jgi:ATP-dependent Clp protease adaptor protein ClpS
MTLHDDDFVIHVLEVFQKSPAEAFRIMMQVHVNGRGIAGVYPWEVADTKVETVSAMARDAGYPLRAALEEE